MQARPVTESGATSERLVDLDPLLKDAVMVAELLVVKDPTVSSKVTVAEPAGTVTLAGPLTAPIVPMETGSPSAGAFPLSESVHVVVC